nr:helix-turn-helix domain-containing protein [Streptomyces rhizoryzae]
MSRFGRGLACGLPGVERTSVSARDLRVSKRSVERWRRAWREGGVEALRSVGRSGLGSSLRTRAASR